MKTIKTVIVVPEYVDFMPLKDKMQQDVIYISEKFNTSTHLCLCGCGNEIIIPFSDKFPQNNWHFIKEDDKISFTPSIGNYYLPCSSHYIITKNKANFV